MYQYAGAAVEQLDVGWVYDERTVGYQIVEKSDGRYIRLLLRKKPVMLTIRCTPAQAAIVSRRAEGLGMSVNRYCVDRLCNSG